jgi:membrane protease YdiL (CAAX protease family)
MEVRNRLKPWHGIVASLLVIAFMLFGGSLLYAVFGEIGGYLAGTIVALIGLAFVLLTKTKFSEAFPFALPSIRQFFAAVALFVGVFFLNGAIGVLQAQVIPDFYDRQAGISDMVRTLSPAVAILLVAVQPAICEEFFCRGFLVAACRKLKHEWLIILVTALFFGAIHLDLYSFLPTAIMGAAFAFIALRTKSLLIPMMLHFGNNALSVVLAYAGGEAVSDSAETIQSLSLGMLLSYLAFYLGLALFFLWFGGRWFCGKKLLTKSSLAIFIVAAILITFGYGLILINTMDMVAIKTETVTYAEAIHYEIPQTLEAGEYAFSVVATAADPIRIAIKQGDDYIVSTAYNTSQQLAQPLTLAEGTYSIVILSEEGTVLEGGTVTVAVSVMRIDLS